MLNSICFDMNKRLQTVVGNEGTDYPIVPASITFHASDYEGETLTAVRENGSYSFISNGIDWAPVE